MSSFEALIAEAGKPREVATEYQKYLQYYEECFKTAKRLLVEGRSSRTVMTAENLEALKHEWLSWLSPRLLAVLRDHETKHTPAWELFPFYLDRMHDPARIHTNIVILPEIGDEQDEGSRAAIAAVTPCPCDDRQPNSEFGSRRMAPVSGAISMRPRSICLGGWSNLRLTLDTIREIMRKTSKRITLSTSASTSFLPTVP